MSSVNLKSTTVQPRTDRDSAPTPRNLEAEQSVIGAMLRDSRAISEAFAHSETSDYYSQAHRTIVGRIKAMHERGAATDFITLVEELRRHDQLGDGDGQISAAYLQACIEACDAPANVAAHAKIVSELSHKRQALILTAKARDHALNGVGPGVALTELRKSLDELEAKTEAERAPKGHTAAGLLKLKLPDPKWAVKNTIPVGVSLLVGPPKIGKSWLTYSLSIAVATGGRALGSIEVEQGEALYLALEDNRRRLQSRLQKLLSAEQTPPAGLENLHLFTEWERINEGGLRRLETWMKEHPNTRLIVIDTLEKMRPRRRSGGNIYADDYAACEELKSFADAYGVAVLIVHHTRKGMGDDAVEAVSGSYGLTGGVDGVITLKRERGRGDASLFITGRDVNEQDLALGWNAELCLWSILGDADEYRLSAERAAVVDALRTAKRAMTPKELSDVGVGTSYSSLKKTMWTMAKAGQLNNIEGGKYLPISGNSGNSSNSTPPVNCSNSARDKAAANEGSGLLELPELPGSIGVGEADVPYGHD